MKSGSKILSHRTKYGCQIWSRTKYGSQIRSPGQILGRTIFAMTSHWQMLNVLSQRFWSPQGNGPPEPNSSTNLVRGGPNFSEENGKRMCDLGPLPWDDNCSVDCHIYSIKPMMAYNEVTLQEIMSKAKEKEDGERELVEHVYQYLAQNHYLEGCDKNHKWKSQETPHTTK